MMAIKIEDYYSDEVIIDSCKAALYQTFREDMRHLNVTDIVQHIS